MRSVLAFVALAFLLQACGNKGPLYLPGPGGEDPKRESRSR